MTGRTSQRGSVSWHAGEEPPAGPESKESGPPAGGQHAGHERLLGHLAWIGSALTTAILCMLGLRSPSLWADELATWGMVSVPGSEMVALLREFDGVLAPYYVLMRGWVALAGSSDVALRLPSLLAMSGAAALVAALGTRLAGARCGLVAGLIFAVLPTTSRYGQEARPYALTLFAAVLATLLLTRVLDRPDFRRLALYAGAVALVGLLHPIALALLAAHGCAVLAVRPSLLPRWAAAALAGAAPALPLLWLGYGQRAQISWIPIAGLEQLELYPMDTFVGATALAGVMFGLALLSVSLRYPEVVYASWALIPTAIIFGLGWVIPLWTPRYVVFTLPAWALLVATTLARTSLSRAAVAVALIAVLGIPAQLGMRTQGGHGQDARELATLLTSMAQPGDGVVYGSWPGEALVSRDAVARYVPAAKRPEDLLARRPVRTGGSVFTDECPDVAGCLGDVRRMWLVRSREIQDPLAGVGAEKEGLLRSYAVTKVWHPYGFTLALLERKAP
jgi:mannosyltransferase